MPHVRARGFVFILALLTLSLFVFIGSTLPAPPRVARDPGAQFASASSDTAWRYNKATGHYYRLTTGRYHGISTEQNCPSGAGAFVDSCLTPTWLDAEIEAQALGGHLVTINDATENQWLFDTFGTHEYWIGFTDHDLYSTERNWVWTSGQPVTYTNWDVGQPDDQDFGEDCAHFNHQAGQLTKWNDLGNYLSPIHPELPLCGIVESTVAPPPNPCAGNALLFDGVDDMVLIAHSPSLNLGAQGTIEFWVMVLNPPPAYHVLGKRDQCGTIEYQCARDPGNLFHTTHGGQCLLSAGNLPANVWTHVAFTFTSTECRVYFNGSLVASAAASGTPTVTSAPLELGVSGTCGGFLSGMLDEVRIWNVARTPVEIANSYRHPVPPSTSGLVAYYKFDEAVADQNVLDSSPQGNNGTLGSTPAAESGDPARVPSWTPAECPTDTRVRDVPGARLLVRSYPNPFNPETTVEFLLPREGNVSVRIYDVAGRLVRVLFDGRAQAGSHRVRWNGRSDGGGALSSGVYFVRLDADGDHRIAKVVLMK